MPIYDFQCCDCQSRFEALVLRSSATCPSCGSSNLEQQLSMFAVSSEGTRQSSLASARLKNSKTSRDKVIAEEEARLNHDH